MRHHLPSPAAVVLAAMISGSALAGGTSITLTPANNIQATINSGLYTEIVLSPGTYNQLIDFDGAALTLRSTDPDDPAVVAATVLDGSNLGSSVVVFDDDEGPDSILLGLTITGGDAGSASPNDRGGGIRCFPGAPTIDRCVIRGNSALNAGGGLYFSGSTPTIIDSEFRDNVSLQGGGIYANGASATFTLRRCLIAGNLASTAGAGVRTQGGVLRLLDSAFRDNIVEVNGGGVYVNDTVVQVERSIFSGNQAERGGALYTLNESGQSTVSDSVFDTNVASVTGGGSYVRTPFVFRNVTFVGNTGSTAALTVASGSTDVISSIFWNNDGAADLTGGSNVTARYCLVEGGFAGVGNIETDPMFVAAADGDYRLAPESPAIDAGDTAAVNDEYPRDFLGRPRALDRLDTPDRGVARLGITVDIGALEFQPEPSGGNPDCPADIDLSGEVDFGDLLAVLSAFGGCP